MDINTSAGSGRASAKIYQFPLRVRADVVDRRQAADAVRLPNCDAAFGACWYHEAALTEALESPRLR
jgi:hypothetical protein